MKRRRNSRRCSVQPHNSDETAHISNTSITDLPSTMLVEIFLKLPTKSIVMCKSACKTWRALISAREFVRVHSAQAKDCTLIRDNNGSKFSRRFYLLEDDDQVSGYCRCSARNNEKCKQCRVNTPVNARLKAPLRNPQNLLSILGDNNIDDTMFCIARTRKGKNVVNLKTSIDQRDGVMNSCNGLLCLYDSYSALPYNGVTICNIPSPVVVCNPVTGEFMHLPNSPIVHERKVVFLKAFGFGFSPKHNEYKVIRLIDFVTKLTVPGYSVAEIHTLGTKSWRRLDLSVPDLGSFEPAYLDGALHWLVHKKDENGIMVSFDLNEERFQVHSLPFQVYERAERTGSALRVFGGRLYTLDASADTHVQIWVMNENGNHKYWTKSFSVDIPKQNLSEYWSGFEPKHFQLLYVNKDAVVMLNHFHGDEFIYCDRLEGMRFKRLKFHGSRMDSDLTLHIIAYTPSFINLKDIVGPGNAEVLNINSGCGKLKLLEEIHPLMFGGASRFADYISSGN